jgi:hypothetical protein
LGWEVLAALHSLVHADDIRRACLHANAAINAFLRVGLHPGAHDLDGAGRADRGAAHTQDAAVMLYGNHRLALRRFSGIDIPSMNENLKKMISWFRRLL